jgi:hypothetical protein
VSERPRKEKNKILSGTMSTVEISCPLGCSSIMRTEFRVHKARRGECSEPPGSGWLHTCVLDSPKATFVSNLSDPLESQRAWEASTQT